MDIKICLLLLISFMRRASCQIPNLNADCYGVAGDINLGLLSGFSNLPRDPVNEEDLCYLTPNPWLPVSFQFQQAFVYAIDEINNKSGLLPNISLGYIVMDSCWRALAALGQTLKLLNISNEECHVTFKEMNESNPQNHLLTSYNQSFMEGSSPNFFTCSRGCIDLDVFGIVGPGGSGESAMVAGLASLLHMPMLATLATNDDLSDKSKYSYFSRMVPPDKFTVETMLNFVAHYNWTYVSLLYSEGAYGENAAKMVQETGKSYNICLSVTDMLSPDLKADEAEEVVYKLSRHLKARIIIAFIQYSQLLSIQQQLVARGIEKNFIWVLGSSLVGADLGKEADGSFICNSQAHSVPEFDEHYFSLTLRQQPYNPFMKYIWQVFFDCSWDRVPIGKTSCLDYVDTPISNRFKTRNQFVINSVSLYIDGVYAFSYALDALIRKNCPSAFSDKAELAKCINGPLLLSYLRNTKFKGYSADVSFDKNGDRLGKLQIRQYNSDRKPQHKVVAELDKDLEVFTVFDEAMEWGLFTGVGEQEERLESICSEACGPREFAVREELPCCWECRSCRGNEKLVVNGTSEWCEVCPELTWPDDDEGSDCVVIPPDFLRWNDVASLILYGITFLLLIPAILFFIWIIYKREIKLIKASSIQLCSVILIGIALALVTGILMLTQPQEISCLISTVGFHISVAMIFVPLLTKTARVYRIFTGSKKGVAMPSLTSNRSVNTLTAVLIFIQLVVTMISSLAFPTHARVAMPVQIEKVVELFCDVPMMGFVPSLIFNLVIILSCAILGFLTRHLPGNFNESYYIFVAVSTTVFTWLIFIPTYLTVKNAIYRVILLVSSLLLNAAITMVSFFVPKVYAVYFYDERLLRYVQGTASSNTSKVGTVGLPATNLTAKGTTEN